MSKITSTQLHLGEAASAGSSTAAQGQIWVKSDTPSSLYHTDDAGTDHRINGITLTAEQATTSTTAIDFTGIPVGVKRITVMLDGVSTDGSSVLGVQLGDTDGFETSGYVAGVTQTALKLLVMSLWEKPHPHLPHLQHFSHSRKIVVRPQHIMGQWF